MCICGLLQFILKIKVNSSPLQASILMTKFSNSLILCLACFDVPPEIHWPAYMVALRFLMSSCLVGFQTYTR